jgi:hypothetical protein
MRECVCDGRRHPEQATALHVLRLFAAGPLALARPSNDVLVKSQESRAKSQEPRVKYIDYSGIWAGDVGIRPFGKGDCFFLEPPFLVFLNGFGVVLKQE